MSSYVFSLFFVVCFCVLSYISVQSLKLDLWLLCQHNYNYSIIIIIAEHYRRYILAVLNVVVACWLRDSR